MAEAGKKHYALKPVIAPLKPVAANDADASTPNKTSPYLRAENEDDDGYDPYSDRRSEPPLFEADPWS